MRATHPCEWSSWRSPGSRTESFCACQGLRPRRAADARENAPSSVAFHVVDRVGTREFLLTRLNTWPTLSPSDASPPVSRLDTHGLGSMWIALPSLWWTLTTYSLPVSRRTGNYRDTGGSCCGSRCATSQQQGKIDTRMEGRYESVRRVIRRPIHQSEELNPASNTEFLTRPDARAERVNRSETPSLKNLVYRDRGFPV